MATGRPEYIVNKLLTYLSSKLNYDTNSDVTNALHGFYCDKGVNDDKMVLWRIYSILVTLERNVCKS